MVPSGEQTWAYSPWMEICWGESPAQRARVGLGAYSQHWSLGDAFVWRNVDRKKLGVKGEKGGLQDHRCVNPAEI